MSLRQRREGGYLRVLRVLAEDLEGPHYSFAICQKAKVGKSTLYPALVKMEARGLVSAAWTEQTDGTPRLRGYRLTYAGMMAAQLLPPNT